MAHRSRKALFAYYFNLLKYNCLRLFAVTEKIDSVFEKFFNEELAKHIDEFQENLIKSSTLYNIEGYFNRTAAIGIMQKQSNPIHPRILKIDPMQEPEAKYSIHLSTSQLSDLFDEQFSRVGLVIEPCLDRGVSVEVTCNYLTWGIHYPRGYSMEPDHFHNQEHDNITDALNCLFGLINSKPTTIK